MDAIDALTRWHLLSHQRIELAREMAADRHIEDVIAMGIVLGKLMLEVMMSTLTGLRRKV